MVVSKAGDDYVVTHSILAVESRESIPFWGFTLDSLPYLDQPYLIRMNFTCTKHILFPKLTY